MYEQSIAATTESQEQTRLLLEVGSVLFDAGVICIKLLQDFPQSLQHFQSAFEKFNKAALIEPSNHLGISSFRVRLIFTAHMFMGNAMFRAALLAADTATIVSQLLDASNYYGTAYSLNPNDLQPLGYMSMALNTAHTQCEGKNKEVAIRLKQTLETVSTGMIRGDIIVV